MQVTIVDAVDDPEDMDAAITYAVDGVRKKTTWAEIYDLSEQRRQEVDQGHSPEQQLLALIVERFWFDSPDWWEGASASDDVQTQAVEPQ